MTIGWSLEFLEQILPEAIYSRIPECTPDPRGDEAEHCEELWIRNGQTGKLLTILPVPGVRRMNIQKVKRLLSEGLSVSQGKRFDKVECSEQGVVALFEDGTRALGTVLVGADGGGSLVRRSLFPDGGAEPEDLPFAFMNIATSYTAEQALFLKKTMNPHVDVGVHPKSMYLGLFLLDMPDPKKPETWIFYVLASWPKKTSEDFENSGDRLQRLRDNMDDWAEPYKSAVAWIPDGTHVAKDSLTCWEPKPWNNHGGRVTLAGDAAHAINHCKSIMHKIIQTPVMHLLYPSCHETTPCMSTRPFLPASQTANLVLQIVAKEVTMHSGTRSVSLSQWPASRRENRR